jgi:cobalt-zinc-cadmium efflux system outer membrane protein
MFSRIRRALSSGSWFDACLSLTLSGLVGFTSICARAQSQLSNVVAATQPPLTKGPEASNSSGGLSTVISLYFDPTQGTSSAELVRRALLSNGELAAARLEIERARARLRQAGLRPNPTIDFSQTTGGLTGSPGERDTSIGITLPLEVSGQRARRIDVAQAELEASEAEVADRERRLTGEVLEAYAEALAALRELQITEGLNDIDVQTASYVQVRVNEGESAPIELSLLQVEVDRLKSRRALVEGRLQAALLKLKSVAGISPDEPLRLREDLASPSQTPPPGSIEAAVDVALRTRPDLRLARLTEEAARAGLRLAQVQARPDVALSTKYSQDQTIFNDTPVGPIRNRDKLLTFGVSVSLPVFNRNQGGKAEAAVAITQAQKRREFLEQVVKAEVRSAYARYEAANRALAAFESGVIARSTDNIRRIRAAYQLGEYRVSDLLAEQRRLLDSQRDFTETLSERYKALSDIQLAIGATGSNTPAAPGK